MINMYPRKSLTKKNKLNPKELIASTPLWTGVLTPHVPWDKNYYKINSKQYNLELLKADLKILQSKQWINKDKENNKWESITLKSFTGDDQSFLVNTEIERGENNKYKYTEHIHDCNYFRKILHELSTDVYLVRILKLKAGGKIKFHTDEIVFRDTKNIMRVHLPIITNPGVKFQIGYPLNKPAPNYEVWNASVLHEKYLEPGYLWYTNVNTLHGVDNRSEEDRYHLVMDIRPYN